MSRANSDREKFIEMLQETPLISYACKRLRLSRTTIYRWRKSNPEFKEKLDAALEFGRDNVNDMAEACLVQKIQDKDMGAIKFWLQHNNPKYIPVRTVYVEPPHSHGKLKPGVPCKQCGHTTQKGFNPFDAKKKKTRKELLKDILIARHKKEASEESMEKFYLESWDRARNKISRKIKELEERNGITIDMDEPEPGDPPRKYAYE